MWVEVLCWVDRVWSSKECVCCSCDPSVHLDVPSIGFFYVCVYISSVYSPFSDQVGLSLLNIPSL